VIWFVQDEALDLTEREIVTLWGILSEFGGFLEFVVIITAFFVGSFQEFVFHSSIISRIFLYDKEKEKEVTARPHASIIPIYSARALA